MLARINFEVDSLDSSAPAWMENQIHEELLRAVLMHGRLVFAGNAEILSLVRELKSGGSLSPQVRKLWDVALKQLREMQRIEVSDSRAEATDAHTLEGLRQKCGGRIDVAVVSEATSRELGVPRELGYMCDQQSSIEVANVFSATRTPTLKQLRDEADHGFTPTGSSRESFWTRILRPMVEGARSVTILDAYLFGTLWARQAGRGWARRFQEEHVGWLLRELDEVMAVGSEVRLISAWGREKRDDLCPGETADLVRHAWNPSGRGRLGRVDLVLPEAQELGQKFPHDRHIRSSLGVALLVNAGFDRLRDGTISDLDGMNWHYRWEPKSIEQLVAAENRVIRAVRTPTATVLQR